MASVEIIGLLCAGSVKYHEALGSAGAVGVLSRPELAGLLSGLSSVAMNLAMAKYAADLAAERMLIAQVREWAAGVAVRDGWKIVRGRPTVCNMAALAVFEVVRPNLCRPCCGSGWRNDGVSVVLCKSCGGSAFKSLSTRDIAEAIGVAETTYRDTWRPRYERFLAHVQGIDGDINRILIKSDREHKIYV